jgi:undecaprenyl-diphosphatase
VRTPRDGRLNPALSPRLLLAGAGFLVAVVPVGLLAYLISHGWGPLHALDQGAAEALHRWAVPRPGAVRFLSGMSIVLHPQVLRVAAVVAAGWLALRGQRRLALWVVVTAIGSGVIDTVLKDVVRRARPALPDPVAEASGYSFPSGHALGTVVIFGMTLLLVLPLLRRPAARAAAWVVAVGCVALVGFARVALGVHYVSDVLAGWLVGLGWLAVTVATFESWRRSRGRRSRTPGDVLHEGVDPAGSRLAAHR